MIFGGDETLAVALGIVVASGFVGACVVEVVRRYALSSGLMDVPNRRSSHEVPTPRGGGVGIVLPVLSILAVAGWLREPDPTSSYVGGLAVLLTAVVGWLDDRSTLPILPRLAVHVAAGALVAFLVMRQSPSGLLWISGGMAAAGLWAFWTVSAINVVNFMDGTDGLVGVQAVVYAGFCAVVLHGSPAASVAHALLGASAGFLLFNWPPARIFMGDVGSGALGVVFVLLGLYTVRRLEWTVVHAFFPLMPMFVDELLTLIRRLADGEKPWKAHRRHVYQVLVREGWPHGRVALLYGFLAAVCAGYVLLVPDADTAFAVGALALMGGVAGLLLQLRRRALGGGRR